MANVAAAHAVLFERRILLGVTIFLAVGFILWLIAISTTYWTVVDGGKGIFVPKKERFFLQSHSGIWTTCRTTYSNKTSPPVIVDRCAYNDLVPKTKIYDKTVLDYQRTVASFSIISILILLMGFTFACYTFRQTRYMYKRLAACNHVISAGCVLIVIEVSVALTRHAAIHLPIRHPPGSTWNYSFSFILAWITFIAQVIAAVTFAVCSRKRKKDKAPDERFAIEEEPTIIGR